MQNFEVLDDALYTITKANVLASQVATKTALAKDNQNRKPAANLNAWEKEEETIRKKMERSSINMMKSKVAQQNRANVDQSTG